jgi:hypothetical protein
MSPSHHRLSQPLQQFSPHASPSQSPSALFSYSRLPFGAKRQPLSANSFRIRTSAKCACNPFKMNTYKTKDLKSFRMNTYTKKGRGVVSNRQPIATFPLLAIITFMYPLTSVNQSDCATSRCILSAPGRPNLGIRLRRFLNAALTPIGKQGLFFNCLHLGARKHARLHPSKPATVNYYTA